MRITIYKTVGDVSKTVTIDEFGEHVSADRLKEILAAIENAHQPQLPQAAAIQFTEAKGQPVHYEVVAASKASLVIRDMSKVRGGRTVTNGVENVVAGLYATGLLWGNRRFFYYDSAGEFSEIKHKNGCFVGFEGATPG